MDNTINFNGIPFSSLDESQADDHGVAWSISRAPTSALYTIPNPTPNQTGFSSLVPSSSVASNHHQSHRHPVLAGPADRHLSLLDPLSDRVSTILVWKNLTVLTREDKVKECFQRAKFWKKFQPKRQTLLNNVSGAITGGLWAVMGKSV